MAGHPRLYFGPGDLERLSARARTGADPDWLELDAFARRDRIPSAEPLSTGGSLEEFVALAAASVRLTNASLAAAAAGTGEHLEAARAFIDKLCREPEELGRDYALGLPAIALAAAYDWLHDRLDDAERIRIRARLATLVELLGRATFTRDRATRGWWAGLHLHHDNLLAVAGCGAGALAIAGEWPPGADWARRAREELGTVFALLGDDGAWPEGAGPWTFAIGAILAFVEPWSRFAPDDTLHATPWLRRTGRFRLHARLPDGTYCAAHDSHRAGHYAPCVSASAHVLHRLAAVTRDVHLSALAAEEEARAVGDEAARREAAAWTFLWRDPSVVGPRPLTELPLAAHFDGLGLVFARSAWDPAAAAVSFSCGPQAGHRFARAAREDPGLALGSYEHAHDQANAFTFFAGGEYLVVPPGYGLRDARNQNTVLVDGAALLADGRRAPRIERVDLGEGHVYALGDATEVYAPELQVQVARRHLLFLHPDRLVVFDEVVAGSRDVAEHAFRTRRYEARLHFAPELEVRVAGGRVLVGRKVEAGAPVLEVVAFQEGELVTEDERVVSAGGGMLLRRVNFACHPARNRGPRWWSLMVLAFHAAWDGAEATSIAHVREPGCEGAFIPGGDLVAVFYGAPPPGGGLRWPAPPGAVPRRHVLLGLAPGTTYRLRDDPAERRSNAAGVLLFER